jgi:ubiquitin fusion degradation protein 1
MVAYNNKKYYIDIVETKPSNAISIIETDCEVDFAPPLDYKEPEKPVPSPSTGKAPAEGEYYFNLFSIVNIISCC